MLAASAIAKYKTVQVTTCSPGELLIMLYNGLFRFLGEAANAIKTGDKAVAGERIGRSHDILSELVAGLNPTYAPELCDNLQGIYLFCMGRIVEANLHQDPKRIEEVIRILSPLREAWTIAVRQAPAPQGTLQKT